MGLAWNICTPLGTLSTFVFNPVFQVSTAKNEINLFNNHILIVAPVTFAPAGAMTPSAEFLFITFYCVFNLDFLVFFLCFFLELRNNCLLLLFMFNLDCFQPLYYRSA